jgi:chloramphenicol-sensitive protein RarD
MASIFEMKTATLTSDSSRDAAMAGVFYGITAFGIWGLVPIYYKALGHVSSLEIVAHRVVWAMVALFILVLVKRQGRIIVSELRNLRNLVFYLITTVLVSSNWLIFIWAIHNDRLLESSLGYYINPLVSVVLGVLFLRERLNGRQILAVALAAVGVLNLIIRFGSFPWIALTLALTFGLYGLLRKRAGGDAIRGLSIETLLATPIALIFLGTLALHGGGAFGRINLTTDVLLVFAGIVTAIPLVCFLQAARRLHLSTVGLMQYLAPTLNFLLAVMIYGEPFTRTHLITFACIWVALAIYSFDVFSRATKIIGARRKGLVS